MNALVVVLNSFLYRLDGWGGGDGFLPISPFSKWRCGGINYTRYAIGLAVWACTCNPVYLLTYSIAVSVPYGEKHWWMRYGLWSWFGIGLIWGGASLNHLYALFMASVVVITKYYDLDQAWWEFGIMGGLGTAWLLIK